MDISSIKKFFYQHAMPIFTVAGGLGTGSLAVALFAADPTVGIISQIMVGILAGAPGAGVGALVGRHLRMKYHLSEDNIRIRAVQQQVKQQANL